MQIQETKALYLENSPFACFRFCMFVRLSTPALIEFRLLSSLRRRRSRLIIDGRDTILLCVMYAILPQALLARRTAVVRLLPIMRSIYGRHVADRHPDVVPVWDPVIAIAVRRRA